MMNTEEVEVGELHVMVPVALLGALADVIAELGEDLTAELDDRYPRVQRNNYQSYARKHERDMAPVRRAHELLADLKEYADGE